MRYFFFIVTSFFINAVFAADKVPKEKDVISEIPASCHTYVDTETLLTESMNDCVSFVEKKFETVGQSRTCAISSKSPVRVFCDGWMDSGFWTAKSYEIIEFCPESHPVDNEDGTCSSRDSKPEEPNDNPCEPLVGSEFRVSWDVAVYGKSPASNSWCSSKGCAGHFIPESQYCTDKTCVASFEHINSECNPIQEKPPWCNTPDCSDLPPDDGSKPDPDPNDKPKPNPDPSGEGGSGGTGGEGGIDNPEKPEEPEKPTGPEEPEKPGEEGDGDKNVAKSVGEIERQIKKTNDLLASIDAKSGQSVGGETGGDPNGECSEADRKAGKCGSFLTFSECQNFDCAGDDQTCYLARREWEKNCDIINFLEQQGKPDGLTGALNGFIAGNPISDINAGAIDASSVMNKYRNGNGVKINGSCPAPDTTNVLGATFTIDYAPLCQLASIIHFFLVSFSLVGAGLLIAKFV